MAKSPLCMRVRFNAATANSPWRTLANCLADETLSNFEASMRPRRIRRGEPGVSVIHFTSGHLLLQCGHGEFAVENDGSHLQPAIVRFCFNAATANSPWRTRVIVGADVGLSP